MLNLDSFEKAWNALEWNLSFSIGDGASLFVASVTIVVAWHTYRIQKEQKEIVKRQVDIETIKSELEKKLVKGRLSSAIFNIGYSYKMGNEPIEKWFDLITDKSVVLNHYFCKEVVDFVASLQVYHLANSKHVVVTGGEFNKEKALEEIKKDFDYLLSNSKLDSSTD